ncbi:MAG TPA: hypothetical protein VI216_00370 [Candidatus Acidoferrales bacterium]
MTRDTDSTRRSFLKGGALLAAPLAAAVPAVLVADDGLRARLAKLENEAAIRELHQGWLRRINTRTGDATTLLFADAEGAAPDQAVRNIAADHAGEPDVIDIAADGKSAVGRFRCIVEIENAIAQDCTLARMARAQGGGFVRRSERRVLKVEYVKVDGMWAIAKANLASV